MAKTGLTANRKEFRNNTEGYIGVIQYAPNGDEKAIAVAPGDVVWLNESEVELTSRAPKSAADNPFIEQRRPIRDEDGEIVDYEPITPLTLNTEKRANPLRPEAQREVSRQRMQPARGVAAEGSNASDEEIGTPGAQSTSAKRRRRATA